MDSAAVWSDESEDVATAELAGLSASDLRMRTSMIDSEVRILKSEVNRLRFELHSMQERIKDNREKIRLNRQLPYLVANVVELFDSEDAEEEEEDGAVGDIDAQRKGKCVVIKTSTRQSSEEI
ncbi:26S proteasome regulatory subunit, S6a family AAA ATpase [Toxoplasma gondii TgCatPRC2]|uniref:26S proteasome regulatory subunit, S6a family AAA ATpase n=1 Tax=Toxoplasma gondii TgCatPRC2 TaxID=1130821 RepID=A0A151H0C1_TOXGO|nr:26S proteasome regulatory subunit, S6a family AAA ATpase [Toxoplasma gondii TgCatPRC2]